jgi:hypothetical protein
MLVMRKAAWCQNYVVIGVRITDIPCRIAMSDTVHNAFLRVLFLADGNFAFPHRLLVCPNGEPRVRPGSGGEGGALSREKSVRFRVNDQIMAACRSG